MQHPVHISWVVSVNNSMWSKLDQYSQKSELLSHENGQKHIKRYCHLRHLIQGRSIIM